MKKLTPINYIFGHIKKSLSNVKTIIKKPIILLPTIIISIIWAILSYLVAKGNTSQTIYILSIITFAQGGMYGGLIGTIGGIIGKSIIAVFITKLFNKNKKVKEEKIKGNDKMMSILGIGMALIIYNFLSTNASLENAIIGVTLFFTIFKETKNTKGFWYGFPMSFSNKITKEQVKSLLSGMSSGLIIGVIVSCFLIKGNRVPYIIGVCLIVLLLVVKIIKKPKVVLTGLVIVFSFIISINSVFADTISRNDTISGLNTDYTISGIEIVSVEEFTDYYGKVIEIRGKYNGDKIVIKGSVTNTQYVGFLNINTAYGNIDNKREIKNFLGETREYEVILPLDGSDNSAYIKVFGVVYGKDWDSSAKYDKFEVRISLMKNSNNSVIEKESNKNDGTFHKNVEETLMVSLLSGIGSLIAVLLGTGISGGSIGSIPEETYILRDPASGAETEYVKDPTTGEWISRDGSSILDKDRIPGWEKQRTKDKEWMNEQSEKIKNDKSLIEEDKKMKEQLEKDLKEITDQTKKSDEEWNELKRRILKNDIAMGERKSKLYRVDDLVYSAELVLLPLLEDAADSIIDGYGLVNKKFAAGYKLTKGSLVGWTTGGKSGLIKGTIEGAADASLVYLGGNAKMRASVRAGSRIVSNIAEKIVKDDEAYEAFKNGNWAHSKIKKAFKDGGIDGGANAFVGYFLDKTKAKTKGKFESGELLEHEAMEQIANQRTLIRITRDYTTKPFGNYMKGN